MMTLTFDFKILTSDMLSKNYWDFGLTLSENAVDFLDFLQANV